MYSQNKKDLFLGVEIGNNTIISFKEFDYKNSLQGGVLAEYYFNKYWSISSRIKYFKTGVSFDNKNKPTERYFEGTVISIPFNVNIHSNSNYKVCPKLNIGLAWNHETESNYNYVNNYSKSFVSINLNVGIDYKFDENYIIFGNLEGYFFGGSKGNDNDIFLKKNYYSENILLNIGIKRKINFKKSKE
jgi:Outer membrane protein beta-barrel domain